jgi:polar amino acid transport system substrate-binding protein
LARRTPSRALVSLPALALALTACAQSTEAPNTASGVSLINPAELSVCTHLDYRPFQFKEGPNIIGFDVELVDLIAKDLGVPQRINDTSFEGIESGASLDTAQCDLAAAAISITDKRKQKLDFSEPYFDAKQALVTKTGSGIRDLAGLRGKTVGTQLSTVGEQYAKDNAPANGYRTVQFDDLPLQVTAVQTNQVAGAINDNSVLGDFIKNHKDVEISAEFDTGDQYGLAMRKGNTALANKVNESLRKLRQNGEYNKIYQKWFGKLPQ